jgi:2'-5' RNA ligase
MNEYTIVVCLPHPVAGLVISMKELLEYKSTWFHGRNSFPHITFNHFFADEKEIAKWKNYLQHYCRYISPFDITLSKTDYFHYSRTCYLSLDDCSKKITAKNMHDFHKNAPFKAKDTFTLPHVTIGSQLEAHHREAAQNLWTNITFNFKFLCTGLSLRRLDNKIRQYIVEQTFPFKGEEQLTLF